MKKIILLMLFIYCTFCFAQTKTGDFKINLPETKIPNSLYKSILLLDIRTDTASLGIVQKGGFNRKEKVVAEIPLSVQFSDLINTPIDNTAKDGELVLLLRQLSFAEVTGAMSEKGYFHFRAVLFSNEAGQYRKVSSIDTVVVVKAIDVTKKMFRMGSKTVTDFIAATLTKEPELTNESISADQLLLIDSIEKSKLPLYTNTAYTDGLYRSFQSFVNQQPDETGVSVDFYKNEKVKKISYVNKKGETWSMESRFLYAFVYKGKPYISGEFSTYPLEKIGNDFYFTGKVNDAKSSDIATAQVFFGIIGGLIASTATSVFEMKIDHLTGGFIRIKEID